MTGVLLYVRLAGATGLVLAPGALVARALGVRGVAATLAWALAAIFAAAAVTFAAGQSLTVTLVLLVAVAFAALPLRARAGDSPRTVPGLALAGVVLGIMLWQVAGEIGGDGLFHLARVRKLVAFDELSLNAVNEFADGGLHPGYAFPLWQVFLALVAKAAAVDPSLVVLHEASILAPLAVLVAYETGVALFRARGPALAAVAAAVGLFVFAPGNGGAWTALGLPATAARQLLVPAALALALRFVAEPSRALLASAAAAGLALAVVHPTYALFLWLPFGGFLVARALVAPREAGRIAAALAALGIPAAAYFAWLLPVVRETASYEPAAGELRRALRQYAGQLDVFSETSYRLAPEVFGRGGAVAVAALLLLPLAGLAGRRRWAAFVLGGSLAVFTVMLVPALFTAFSDAVSLSQSRRAAGFWPLPFAFAGGLAVLAAPLGRLLPPLALAAGIALQLAWPGDFGYRLERGGPALAAWIAVAGAAAGLVVAAARRPAIERGGLRVAAAAALFVLPVVAHGLSEWSPSKARRPTHLTAGLVEALRERVPAGAIVFSDLETSYRIAAEAPVYVAAAPPGHVADTKQNRPYARRADVRRFLASGDLSIPRRYRAGWLVVDRARFPRRFALPVAYRDGRFTLYRL